MSNIDNKSLKVNMPIHLLPVKTQENIRKIIIDEYSKCYVGETMGKIRHAISYEIVEHGFTLTENIDYSEVMNGLEFVIHPKFTPMTDKCYFVSFKDSGTNGDPVRFYIFSKQNHEKIERELQSLTDE